MVLLLAGCAVPERPPVPEGTAMESCSREIARRSGGAARITDVRLLEGERGIITARTPFGVDYTCFTDAQGRAVHVVVDRPVMLSGGL